MTQDPSDWTAPDLEAIETLARAALEALPAPFDKAAREVVLQVEDFASDELLADLDLDDPFELTGLYDGIPMTEKSTFDQPLQPDTVWLFRRPILDEWATRGDQPLGALVAHVVVHEMAHHFGWSDDDIASIDRWWE
ncbi:metallopeptidase family protein [Pseudoruegeria sp. HB172150]|uniref:metallopeptidase family protein n=1 Tax=Pseudoruegeria sp. HB172150 TaxID=2721164 RepID=UPI001554C7B1|nr:metallopeptidase family protein [Pseudoruegeria sp. HB172150]